MYNIDSKHEGEFGMDPALDFDIGNITVEDAIDNFLLSYMEDSFKGEKKYLRFKVNSYLELTLVIYRKNGIWHPGWVFHSYGEMPYIYCKFCDQEKDHSGSPCPAFKYSTRELFDKIMNLPHFRIRRMYL